MKKKINKVISLTLCCLVISTVAVSAKTKNTSTKSMSYVACAIDPLPHESNPTK